MLSPNEFTESGDKLIQVSPTWKWMAAAKDTLLYKYLPEKK
jgi:hypothetical protein